MLFRSYDDSSDEEKEVDKSGSLVTNRIARKRRNNDEDSMKGRRQADESFKRVKTSAKKNIPPDYHDSIAQIPMGKEAIAMMTTFG